MGYSKRLPALWNISGRKLKPVDILLVTQLRKLVGLCDECSPAHTPREHREPETDGGAQYNPAPATPRPTAGTISPSEAHLHVPRGAGEAKGRWNTNQGLRGGSSLTRIFPGLSLQTCSPLAQARHPSWKSPWEQIPAPFGLRQVTPEVLA